MKRSLSNSCLLVVLVTFYCIVTSDADTFTFSPDNIVQNPVFDIESNGMFPPWQGQIALLLVPGGNMHPSLPAGGNSEIVAIGYPFYQDLPTIPGQEYELSFFAFANWAVFQVDWGQQSYHCETDAYDSYWMEFLETVTASSSTTTLGFERLPGGFAPNFGCWLTAVQVVPIPEPTTFAIFGFGATALLWLRCRP